MDDSESRARVDLACAFRIVQRFGWTDLAFHNLTLRVPGTRDHYLMNAAGLRYDEVTASNLVRVDAEGRPVRPGGAPVDSSGFLLHGEIHRRREDAACIMHIHTIAGAAVAAQQGGLLELGLPSSFFRGDIAYHDFFGVELDFTLEGEEKRRIAEDLGARSALVLRNHGILTCGRTVGEALFLLYQLQRACEIQMAAMAGGTPLAIVSEAAAVRAAAAFREKRAAAGGLMFAAYQRLIDAEAPGYRV